MKIAIVCLGAGIERDAGIDMVGLVFQRVLNKFE